jgi:hypothetical protein
MKASRILFGIAIAPIVAALAIGALLTLAIRLAMDLLLPGGSLQGPEIHAQGERHEG